MNERKLNEGQRGDKKQWSVGVGQWEDRKQWSLIMGQRRKKI
jgi:hypothetical protein